MVHVELLVFNTNTLMLDPLQEKTVATPLGLNYLQYKSFTWYSLRLAITVTLTGP